MAHSPWGEGKRRGTKEGYTCRPTLHTFIFMWKIHSSLLCHTSLTDTGRSNLGLCLSIPSTSWVHAWDRLLPHFHWQLLQKLAHCHKSPLTVTLPVQPFMLPKSAWPVSTTPHQWLIMYLGKINACTKEYYSLLARWAFAITADTQPCFTYGGCDLGAEFQPPSPSL